MRLMSQNHLHDMFLAITVAALIAAVPMAWVGARINSSAMKLCRPSTEVSEGRAETDESIEQSLMR
jgi:hypothetical protein